MSLKTKLLMVWIIFAVLLTASAALSQSPGDVYITPTSGGPGTVVTLVNTNKDFGFQCSAGGAGLGTVAPGGSVTYTVPSDAEGGSFIDFRCFITDVDVSDTVGVFAVSAPLPPAAADSDGDGLPDDADACPKEAASTQNGCPEQAPQPQSPTQAPQQPPPAAPTDVPPAQPPAATRVPLAQLPSSGACVVATLSGTAVNVRQGASTEEAVVGTLNPSRTYPVTARTADGEWYKIDAGWVAARVTRTGGDCGAVPVLSFEGITGATPTPMLIAHEAARGPDFETAFANCREILSQIDRLNFQGQLQLLMIIDQKPDPDARCQAARALLQNRTFARAAVEPNPSPVSRYSCYPLLNDAEVSIFNAFAQRLLAVAPELAERFLHAMGYQMAYADGCQVAHLNYGRIIELYRAEGFGDQDLLTIAVTACPQAAHWDRIRTSITIVELARAGYSGAFLLNSPNGCQIIANAALLGTLSDNQLRLFAVFVQQCGFTDVRTFHDSIFDLDYDMSAAQLVLYADRVAANLEGVLQHVPDLCRDPLTILHAYGFSDAVQRQAAQAGPGVEDGGTPKQFEDCPSVFRAVERHSTDLSPAALLSLLLADNPCMTARQWVDNGTAIPIRLGAASRCFVGLTITPPSFSGSARPVMLGGDIPASPGLPPGSLVVPIGNGDGRYIYVNDLYWFLNFFNRDPAEICGLVDFSNRDIVLGPTTAFDASTPVATVDGMLVGDLPLATPETPVGLTPVAAFDPSSYHIGDLITTATPRGILDPSGSSYGDLAGTFAPAGTPSTEVALGSTPGIGATVDALFATAYATFATCPTPGAAPTAAPAEGGTPDFGATFAAGLATAYAVPGACGTPGVARSLTVMPPDTSVLTPVPADLGEPPTAELTAEIGEPPSALTATPTLVVLVEMTPVPPSGGATSVPSSGGSTPVPPAPTTVASVPTSVPPTSIAGVVPTLPPVTAIAMVPHTTDDLIEMRASLDTLVEQSNVSAARAVTVLGVFQASNLGAASSADLYLLTSAGARALTPDTPETESVPALDAEGQRVAFVSTDTTGMTSLKLIDLTTRVESTLLNSTSDLTVAPYAPAWSPTGTLLLVTLTDSSQQQGIYALDLSDPTDIPAPTLLIANAIEPAITSDGDFVAYAQASGNHRDLMVMQLSTGQSMPITAQTDGSQCYTPSFDTSGLILFFTCAASGRTEFYRYDVGGLKLLALDQTPVGDTVAGTNADTVSLSDGTVIYTAQIDQNDALTLTPLVQLDGKQASNLRWRTAKLATP